MEHQNSGDTSDSGFMSQETDCESEFDATTRLLDQQLKSPKWMQITKIDRNRRHHQESKGYSKTALIRDQIFAKKRAKQSCCKH